MLVYRLNLQPHHLQNIHTGLEELEKAYLSEGNEKEAFKIRQSIEQVEEQLEKQGIQFLK